MEETTVQTTITVRDILMLAGTTGLVTAIFNGLFGWVRDWFDQRRTSREAGRPFALKLMGNLHDYAESCAAEAFAIDDAYDQGHYLVTSPSPFTIPANGEWSYIPMHIASRIRDLEANTRKPDPAIEATDLLHGVEDAARVSHSRLCLRGYEAFELSSELRRKFGGKTYRNLVGVDFPGYLEKRSRATRAGRMRKLWMSYRLRKVRRRVERVRDKIKQKWQTISN